MDATNAGELRTKIRRLLDKASLDPVSRCLADEMEIILRSLEGWESLTALLEAKPA